MGETSIEKLYSGQLDQTREKELAEEVAEETLTEVEEAA